MDKQLYFFIRNTFVLLSIILSAIFSEGTLPAYQKNIAIRTMDLFPGQVQSANIDFSSNFTRPDRQTLRSRLIKIDQSTLNSLESLPSISEVKNGSPLPTLHLPLFENADYDLFVNQIRKDRTGGTSITGVIQGIPFSQVSLEIQNNTLVGDIFLPTKIFQIRPADTDLYIVKQINQSGYPDEHETVNVDPISVSRNNGQDLSQKPGYSQSSGDDGSRIDVLVLYDQAAMDTAGGNDAIQDQIKNIIEETNMGFQNSQVKLRISLAATSLVAYEETNFNWLDALHQLTKPDDGILDGAQTLRNAASADLTVLLVGKDEDYCGISNHMNNLSPDFASSAYAVVNINCASTNFSFAHELGHLMGSEDDRLNAGDRNGVFAYSYGYQDPQGNFRTIMAGAFGCPDACPRINYWSNPSITYDNLPTGIDPSDGNAADNAKSLDGAAIIVANFRDGPSPSAPTALIASSDYTEPLKPIVDLTWTDNSSDETRFDIERSPHNLDQWIVIGNVGADITTYPDTNAAINQLYDYRVSAHSGNGDSDFSNIGTASTMLTPAPPVIHPAAPINIDQVSLSWDPLLDSSASFGKADSVSIERLVNNTGNWQILTSLGSDATSYIDEQVLCDSEYEYRLQAVNTRGASAYSDDTNIIIVCPIPEIPANFQAEALFPNKINLRWTASNYAASYILERSLENTGPWTTIATIPGDLTSYNDSPVKPGQGYSYRILATNNTGSSSFSNIANAFIPWYQIWAPIIDKPG